MRLRALLLDLDGTLADSLKVLYSVYQDFLRARGQSGSREGFERLNGPPLQEGIVILQKELDLRGDPEELYREYMERVRVTYLERATLREGARTLLKRAREFGLDLALVTSAPAGLATAFLRKQGLLEFFCVNVTGDTGCASKPDPAPYLTALRLLEIGPESGVAVEDSEAGVASARGAGLQVWCADLGLSSVLTRLEEELSDRPLET